MRIEKVFLEYDNCAGDGFRVFDEKYEATGFDLFETIEEFENKRKAWEFIVNNKPGNWRDGPPTPKRYEKIPMTEEYFYKVIGMRDELIFEQKDEISKLKAKVNKLELQLKKYKNSQ